MLIGTELFGQPVEFDLSKRWDASLPLANPHKGWYHHYLDNGLAKYLVKRDEDLLEFPGMDHLYLRLGWSYLEPVEGEYHWEVIDPLIQKWTERGYGISFRISCKETGSKPIEQQFATPKWVMEAGAKGGYYRRHKKPGDPSFPWEPRFDDPIFLEKLENFIRVFAARYDGKPWLRYVDVGSIGDWGEGHTSSGSNIRYGWETRLKHLHIHEKYFRKTLVVVTDDYVREAPTAEGRKKLHEYVLQHGMSYRDDSILVDYWINRHPKTFSVANPEYFKAVYLEHPTVLELQHLRSCASKSRWQGAPGTPLAKYKSNGPDFIRGALEQMRATYLGYHGAADEWMALKGNPELSNELLNRCGYWYFPHHVALAIAADDKSSITVGWQNRGVAPAYHDYQLLFRATGPETKTWTVAANNRKWLPGKPAKVYPEAYAVPELANLPAGTYQLAMKMTCPEMNRPVLLPIRQEDRDQDGFYAIGSFTRP
jgi:hypothetical protein